jgi:hypothetical protein
MLYQMKCDICKRELEIGCPITQHSDIITPGIRCRKNNCAGILRQVITPAGPVFVKGGFPATGNEVALPTNHGEDIKFKDKHHARDYLEDHGLMSKWIENDM